ncbi:hypothetical protein, partial [Pseudomonas viridiflava]|uniref:hypothetical protein n=1 Tax=Pseudomonas viridiflava TaxID=33069 RepID=UPI0019D10D33
QTWFWSREYCVDCSLGGGMQHHVFDIALSRGKHRTVRGGLPAMKSDAIFLIYRVIVHRGQALSLIKQPVTH